MEAVEKFRNLLIMAAADQRIRTAELRLLADRAAELGICDDEFESAIDAAIAGRAELTVPKNPGQLRDVFKDMIRMMAADGHLAEAEKQLFAVASAAIGISTDELHRLIDEVLGKS
jgi:hypothetical protein